MKRVHLCAECGGNLEKKIISHTLTWGNEVYHFKFVPSFGCGPCGAAWSEAQVVLSMSETIAISLESNSKEYGLRH